MISPRSRQQLLSGSNPISKKMLRSVLASLCVLMVTLPARAESSWDYGSNKKAETNGTNPKKQKGDNSAADLVRPLTETWVVVFHNVKGEEVALTCEVARTEKDKERGLMFRKSLAKNRGMIFVYNKPEEMNFWMHNTAISLSIAYIHEKLFVSSIHDMKPLSLDIISSGTPVLYAVETNEGWFQKNAIFPGNHLTFYKNPKEYKPKRKNKYRQDIH